MLFVGTKKDLECLSKSFLCSKSYLLLLFLLSNHLHIKYATTFAIIEINRSDMLFIETPPNCCQFWVRQQKYYIKIKIKFQYF